MLTIFGKKKKDEPGEDKQAQILGGQIPSQPSTLPDQSSPMALGQGPSSSPLPSQIPTINQPPPQTMMSRTPPSQPMLRPMPPSTPLPEEETSLTKLLQSLLQDIPSAADTGSGFSGIPESTPDYVPLRSTPPSRPMVIGGRKDDNAEWETQGQPSVGKPVPSTPTKMSKPADIQIPSGKVSPSTPVFISKRDQPVDKAPEKPAKIEKQPEKPVPPKKEARVPQSFDHIFQLTQGNLENSGLVIINGPPGSGKTTLCSALASNYLKMGNPCLYLVYDQAPSGLRDQMKKLGTDAGQFESQFRFIIIDGLSAQNESFSMEPYYLDQPFSFDNIQDTLVRNSGIFAGDKIRVIFDSMDKLAEKVPQKDFAKNFGDLAGKLKDAGATFIATVDMGSLPKDLSGSLSDLADCVIDLSKDDSDPNGRQLKVQKLNQKSSKIDPETFELDSSKGLVFV